MKSAQRQRGSVREPQQERSRQTVEAIVSTARRRLEVQSFRELTLEELVRDAGCTVGAYYHLFGDKRSLLLHLEERFYEGAHEIMDRMGEHALNASVEEVVGRTAEEVTTLYYDWLGPLRALILAAASDPELRARLEAQSRAIADRISGLILPRLRITPEDPERALSFALGAAQALLREVVLFGDSTLLGARLERKALPREMARLVLGYLAAC